MTNLAKGIFLILIFCVIESTGVHAGYNSKDKSFADLPSGVTPAVRKHKSVNHAPKKHFSHNDAKAKERRIIHQQLIQRKIAQEQEAKQRKQDLINGIKTMLNGLEHTSEETKFTFPIDSAWAGGEIWNDGDIQMRVGIQKFSINDLPEARQGELRSYLSTMLLSKKRKQVLISNIENMLTNMGHISEDTKFTFPADTVLAGQDIWNDGSVQMQCETARKKQDCSIDDHSEAIQREIHFYLAFFGTAKVVGDNFYKYYLSANSRHNSKFDNLLRNIEHQSPDIWKHIAAHWKSFKDWNEWSQALVEEINNPRIEVNILIGAYQQMAIHKIKMGSEFRYYVAQNRHRDPEPEIAAKLVLLIERDLQVVPIVENILQTIGHQNLPASIIHCYLSKLHENESQFGFNAQARITFFTHCVHRHCKAFV